MWLIWYINWTAMVPEILVLERLSQRVASSRPDWATWRKFVYKTKQQNKNNFPE